jgi:hypothetical protein
MRNIRNTQLVRAGSTVTTRARTIVTATAVAVFIACSDATAPSTPPPPPPPNGEQPLAANELRPFVGTPTTPPAVNDQIVVKLGVKRGTSAPKLGSFAGTLTFDATAFEFVGESNPGDGVVAVAVTSPGVLTFAGASAEGFATDQLAGATVKVLKTGALASLTLALNELTTVNLEDRKP